MKRYYNLMKENPPRCKNEAFHSWKIIKKSEENRTGCWEMLCKRCGVKIFWNNRKMQKESSMKKKYNFQLSTWVKKREELDSVVQTLRQNRIKYTVKHGRKGYAIFRQAVKGLLKPGNEKVKRERKKCLKCNKSFWSVGRHNRLCESCRTSTHFMNDRFMGAGKSYWGRYPIKT